MNAAEVKTFIRKQIEDVKGDYSRDIEAMSHEQLDAKPSGKARSAYDFTYEVVFVNRRLAKRLRGETPDPMPGDGGWIVAPEDFRNKDKAKSEIEGSMQEILDAWDAFDDNHLLRPIKLAKGETNALDLGYMAAHHASYHDAQLNYVQSLQGDDQLHWASDR
jgi:hypothetical protein